MLRLICFLGSICSMMANQPGYILYDLTNQRIVSQKNAKKVFYPASLTKMLTLYAVADKIKHKKMHFNQKVRFSKKAVGQIPIKLGVRQGDSMRLKDALQAMMITSANDVAHAIGEHVGGKYLHSLYSKHTKALNMKQSSFYNATGLWNEKQITTPMDILKLAVALKRHFPEFLHLASERHFKYNNRYRVNTNKLIGLVDGVRGLKTGFLNKAGWHLVTYSNINGKEYIGVFMGYSTAIARNIAAANILIEHTITKKQMLAMKERARAVLVLRKLPISAKEEMINQILRQADDKEKLIKQILVLEPCSKEGMIASILNKTSKKKSHDAFVELVLQ